MTPTRSVWTIYKLELRSLLRDRRTVLMAIVLPVVLMPILLLVPNRLEQQREERERTRTYQYAVVGTDSVFANALLAELPTPNAPDSVGQRYERVQTTTPADGLEDESLDFYVEGLTASQWREILEADTARSDERSSSTNVPVVRVHLRSNRTTSSGGAGAIRERLLDIRNARRDSIIIAAGFPIDPAFVASVDTANVASIEEVQGARMGTFLTLFLVLLMVTGGSVVATDTLAGEKERGTLVTLLTTAASRTEIVTAKLLGIMSVALAITVVQVVNLWVYLGLGLIDVSSGFSIAVTPAMASGLLLLYLPVVALTASLLLLTSAHARSYKEAQLYLTPVLLGLLVPALAPFLPEVQLTSAIVVVPIANLSIAVRDVLTGQANWFAVSGAWVITAAVAAWTTRLSVHALQDEALITGDKTEAEFVGGPALFRNRVLRWFVVFWAVKVLIDFNVPLEDIRTAAFLNVGLVFGAFTWIVVRHFELDPVEALALRLPKPGAWIGVLLGAPAGIMVATLFFQLMNYVIPVPTELLENFGQGLLPDDIPFWQVMIVLSVIPGIVEELTFRGVLLHGLRTRYGPVGLCLVVGLVFGFFHFQIFRIPGTALLGVGLAAVTLLTGSIYAAMLWHGINNALALYLAELGVEVTPDTWPFAIGAVLALALSFWILWINRTPYPGVGRPGRSGQTPR